MLDINTDKLKEFDIHSLVQAYLFLTDTKVQESAETLHIPIDDSITSIIDEMKTRSTDDLVEYILLDII